MMTSLNCLGGCRLGSGGGCSSHGHSSRGTETHHRYHTITSHNSGCGVCGLLTAVSGVACVGWQLVVLDEPTLLMSDREATQFMRRLRQAQVNLTTFLRPLSLAWSLTVPLLSPVSSVAARVG